MSIVHVKDKGGDSWTFQEVCGVPIAPDFPGDVLPDVPKLKMRHDDVIIAAWMRSGTHWMWEMVSMLANNSAETIPKFKETHMFEYQQIDYYDGLPSPRVFNTHMHFQYLPEELRTRHCKVIYLLRDPRDAMASWYRIHLQHSPFQYKGRWRNWLPVQLEGTLDWGSWFDHVRDWERVFETHPNLDVHLWFYEDMKQNPKDELRKVSEFIGYDTSESLLQAIVNKCNINKMREDKPQYEGLKDGVMHYKKGQVGTWKEVFPVEQYEYTEKVYRDKMAGSKFEERYKGQVETL